MFRTFRSFLFFLAGVIGLCATAGCNPDILKDHGRKAIEKQNVAEFAVDFKNVRAQIITVHCIKCHGPNSRHGDLSTYAKLREFVVPGDAQKSDLFQALKANGGDMPANSDDLNVQEVASLRAWIDAGAPEESGMQPQPPPAATPTAEATPVPKPENPDTPPPGHPLPAPASGVVPVPQPPSDSELISFNEIFAQVIQPKCLKCHDAPDPRGKILLNSYLAIVQNADVVLPGKAEISGLYQVLRDQHMPPKKAIERGIVQAVTPDERDAVKAWINAGAPKGP